MENLSLDEFKNQVVADFKMASLGFELLRTARHEGDCSHVTHSSDVAQVALAKFLTVNDIHISSGFDLTFLLALDRITPFDFFRKLFGTSNNAFLRGDTSFLPMAAGSAMAQKRSGNEGITLCTIGGKMSIDGNFLETVYTAVNERLPLAIVLWNNSGDQSSGNLIKLMGGFSKLWHDALSIKAVRGDNYAALCNTFESQMAFTRSHCAPSLTFVDGVDGLAAMGEWICMHKILENSKLQDIANACRQAVERDRKEAYLRSLVDSTVPIRRKIPTSEEAFKSLKITDNEVVFVGSAPSVIEKAIGMAQRGLVPFVEASVNDIASSSLSDYPDLPIVARITDDACGKVLSCIDNQLIYFPASRSQATALYKQILLDRRQAVVVDTVDSDADFSANEKANCLKIGTKLTAVCYGSGVVPTLDAARMLASDGIDIEVVGCLQLTESSVIDESMAKTRRLLFVDNENSASAARFFFGLMSEKSQSFSALSVKPSVVKPKEKDLSIEASDICEAVKQILGQGL